MRLQSIITKRRAERWHLLTVGMAMAGLAGLLNASTAEAQTRLIGGFNNVGWVETPSLPNLDLPPTYSLLFNEGQAVSPNATDATLGDLQVNLSGITGTANGAGGPVTLSQLIASNDAGQAPFNINSAMFASIVTPPVSTGEVSGTATLDEAAGTSPSLVASLYSFNNGTFAPTYQNLDVAADGAPSIAPLDAQEAGQLTLTDSVPVRVPEPPAILITSTGMFMVGGYLWRRRRHTADDGSASDEDKDSTNEGESGS